jgi:diadenosine tetraphosphate (Ap4A) HIT family hydrolase
MTCPLCQNNAGRLLFRNDRLRLIAVDDPDYPGYTRVIWHDHVAEMTDLPPIHRAQIMDAVYTVERVLRATMSPDKINLAAFGTMVPHLHWHIIPRWRGDRHFPDTYWSAPREQGDQSATCGRADLAVRTQRVAVYEQRLLAAFCANAPH